MNLLFIYCSEPWHKISLSLKRRLKYICPLVEITIQKKNNESLNLSSYQCLMVPLFEEDGGTISPRGLETVRKIQKNNEYNVSVCFLVSSSWDIPDHRNPHLNISREAVNIIKNPEYGDTNKAIFFAEIVYGSQIGSTIKNIINLADIHSLGGVTEIVTQTSINSFACKSKSSFYSTFVDFYNNSDLSYDVPKDVLEKANAKYNELHGIGTGHNVELELFRAPVPFPLQEFVDARNAISKKLKKGGRKIKLLLIDNRSDNKFIVKNDTDDAPKAESLCNLLFSEDDGFGLGDLFEIQMMGSTVYKKHDGSHRFHQDSSPLSKYSDFKGEYEEFKFNRFKESEPLEKLEEEYHNAFIRRKNNIQIETYSDLVYYKIKDSHFVLLDFFLNEEDTYLAFDFIKDMAEIKKHEGDSSTIWYFITSAVYDSVVKYSQSGLLAEHYESAVVSAGDDPTNNKRQIIFIYKLLTFINARLKSFGSYKDLIFKRMLGEVKNAERRPECCIKAKGEKGVKREDPACQGECGKNKCLEEMQTAIKRYLTEYDNIYSLFYDEDEKDKYKSAVVLLDDTITKFLLLPEADWQIIQHQIDYINAKLRKAEGKRQFSCNYISKEIERRSEIY